MEAVGKGELDKNGIYLVLTKLQSTIIDNINKLLNNILISNEQQFKFNLNLKNTLDYLKTVGEENSQKDVSNNFYNSQDRILNVFYDTFSEKEIDSKGTPKPKQYRNIFAWNRASNSKPIKYTYSRNQIKIQSD